MKRVILVVLLLLAAWPGGSSGLSQVDRWLAPLGPIDYYVDADNGDDGDSGGRDDPFATLGAAIAAASAGEVVLVRAGTYTDREEVTVDDLVIVNQPGAWHAAGIVTDRTTTGVQILGGTFSQTGSCTNPIAAGAIVLDYPDGDRVSGAVVLDACNGGITIWADDGDEDNAGVNAEVSGNVIKRAGMQGITVRGVGSTVTDNRIESVVQKHEDFSPLPGWEDADCMDVEGAGHTITWNWCQIDTTNPLNADGHYDGMQTVVGLTGTMTVTDNWFELVVPAVGASEQSNGALVEGACSGLTYVFRRNRVIGFDTPANFQCGASGTPVATIQHNAFVGMKYEFDFTGIDGASSLQNNLFINSPYSDPGGTFTCSNNRAEAAVCTDDIAADPEVNGMLMPVSGSPLIDAGADLSLGHLGTAPDIGIVEVQ